MSPEDLAKLAILRRAYHLMAEDLLQCYDDLSEDGTTKSVKGIKSDYLDKAAREAAAKARETSVDSERES